MQITCCPICGTMPQTKAIATHKLIRCETCKITWTWIGTDIDPATLYEDEVYWVKDNRKSFFEKIILHEASRVLRSASRLNGKPQNQKVLDFGCGKGQFLFKAKQLGWSPQGVETAMARATFAIEKYGIPVNTQAYSSGAIAEGNYQLITLLHVLEHLPDPMGLVEELVKANLNDNGILVIEVPNLKSWQSAIAGDQWLHLDIPKHITHWDEKLLLREFGKIGFSPIKKQYLSLHLGVLGMLSALLGKLGYKQNIIIELKTKIRFLIYTVIALLLPITLICEAVASLFKRGGIIRIYFRK